MIRIYDRCGSAIPPAEIGMYEEKEAEALGIQWSVWERGQYLLYYYRFLIAPGSSQLDPDPSHPEYVQRRWVKRRQ